MGDRPYNDHVKTHFNDAVNDVDVINFHFMVVFRDIAQLFARIRTVSIYVCICAHKVLNNMHIVRVLFWHERSFSLASEGISSFLDHATRIQQLSFEIIKSD